MADWAPRSGRPVDWLSLDAAENLAGAGIRQVVAAASPPSRAASAAIVRPGLPRRTSLRRSRADAASGCVAESPARAADGHYGSVKKAVGDLPRVLPCRSGCRHRRVFIRQFGHLLAASGMKFSTSAGWLGRLAWPGRRHVVGHLRRRRIGGEPVVNPLPELVRQVLAVLEHGLDRGDPQRECHYPAGEVMEPLQ